MQSHANTKKGTPRFGELSYSGKVMNVVSPHEEKKQEKKKKKGVSDLGNR